MEKQNAIIYTLKYYPSLKRKESLPHTTAWMNLEAILLEEVSLSQEDKYCMIPEVFRIIRFRETKYRRRLLGPQEERTGWGAVV